MRNNPLASSVRPLCLPSTEPAVLACVLVQVRTCGAGQRFARVGVQHEPFGLGGTPAGAQDRSPTG